jgi:hypothetical protein
MATTTLSRRRWTDVLKRWPTAVAILLAALSLGGGESDSAVEGYGEALPLLGLGYLLIAKLERRRATWPVVFVGMTAVVVLRALDVRPSVVMVALAVLVVVWSAASGQLQGSGLLRIEALGMVGFAGFALVGVAVDPDLGRYLVAAGWFLHGVWDYVHLWLDKVVARSFAEWCGLFDILVAAILVFQL